MDQNLRLFRSESHVEKHVRAVIAQPWGMIIEAGVFAFVGNNIVGTTVDGIGVAGFAGEFDNWTCLLKAHPPSSDISNMPLTI